MPAMECLGQFDSRTRFESLLEPTKGRDRHPFGQASGATFRHRACGPVFSFLLALGCLDAAAAETRIDRHEFTLSVGSFRIAKMTLEGETDGNSYRATASFNSSGVVNWFTRVRYDGRVHGNVNGNRLVPKHYVETTVSGKEQASGSITYRNGSPVQTEKSPPAPVGSPRASIAEQNGTLDILTSTYMVLRNSPETELCDREFFMFDGTRRTKIELGPKQHEDGEITCNCTYYRIDGFPEKDMAEQVEFPFRLQYGPSREREGWYEIVRLTSMTDYGAFAMVRRK